jgi:hypothetical protein
MVIVCSEDVTETLCRFHDNANKPTVAMSESTIYLVTNHKHASSCYTRIVKPAELYFA